MEENTKVKSGVVTRLTNVSSIMGPFCQLFNGFLLLFSITTHFQYILKP